MFLLGLLLACDATDVVDTPAISTPNTLQLVYSGNVHGEIEPCG